ncbi:MAG: hypothetical protein K0S32_2535 [Bacteroidetes bacterium]|jgi:hypothetical protein|nr:hypothetical protein [Bacteroidota bacterium]
MKKAFIFLFMVALVCSCDNSANEEVRIVEEARKTLNDYFTDIKKEGLSAEFRYLDSSADFYWIPPGYNYLANYDSISAAIKRNATKCKKVDNSWKNVSVSYLSPRHVLYTGTILSLVTNLSNKTDTLELIETGIMIKRDDGWKLLSGHTSILK